MTKWIGVLAERSACADTHHFFALEELPEGFDIFRRQADGAMKVAIFPAGVGKIDGSPRRTPGVKR
jgi:hypothetical protein